MVLFLGLSMSSIFALGRPAFAQDDEMITDRPDFTESPQTVTPGRIQVEGGATYTRSGGDRDTTYGELLVRVPMNRRSELRIGVPSYIRSRVSGTKGSGWDDASLGVKYVLSPGGKGRPVTSLLLGSTLPTGSRSVAEHRYQPEGKLALGWDLSKTVGLGVNLGYARPTDGGVRFSQVLASASFGFALGEKWGAFAEAYGFSKEAAGGSSTRYADTGVSYLVNPDFPLDARIGLGLNNNVGGPDYFTGIGASRRF
jgi:hypothetical protein